MAFPPKRLASGAVVVGILVACDAPTPTGPMPQLTNSGTPGGGLIAGQLIAFASTRDAGLFQTFVMKANGRMVTQLTNHPFYNARPAWSHDGTRITFTACRPWDISCDIYVMNANGSAQTNLTNNVATDHMSVWSPDDRTIAFSSDLNGNWEIYVMDADGSNLVQLTFDPATDLYPGWSPDGSKITFESDRGGDFDIYVMNVDGSSPPTNLTRHVGNDVRARWSPRGNRIAFDTDRDGNQEIYVMRSDGSRQRRLTRDPGFDYGPAWSPDGEAIAFATDRDGNFEIYVMMSDGAEQTRVTNDPGWDADPAWTISKVQLPPEPDPTRCVPSGTQEDINARLRQPGDVALLCAGAVFELSSPVVFSADGQHVHTEGFPSDDRRARLRLASPFAGTAVSMLNRSNVVLSSAIVDGNLSNLGPTQGQALIFAGGSGSGPVIRDVTALESRTWTTIHLFEGCTDALIEHTEIGPSGVAGGIAVACRNSVVRNNTITDVWGVGIGIFGAPGSLVEGNVIRAETRGLFGGINMVDFGFDYRGTRVHANVIDAAGAVIRVAVGMGYRVWFCVDPNDQTNRTLFGATVTDNILRGAHMQYGFAVDGVGDWTVTGNHDLATHSGTPTGQCFGQVASPPAGFQINRARAQGTFQPEFVDAVVEFAVGAINDQGPED